ncbi:DUF4142 domain-containing protein, partial [Corallococcus exiguus]|uniref:DUF4142 domain-containing protein n=1 Tax=Corallococcus exiguus TaxID=83462 RepID=UPI001472DCDC
TNPQPRAATEIEATGSVASQMHTPVPLDAEQLRTLNELATASGSRFDRLYGQTQWTAHRDALALYNSYAANGSDAGMMNYVRSAIPHLEEHAAEARRLPGVSQRR